MTFISFFLAVSLITAQENTCQLTVHLTGLKSEKGQLMIALYESSETWLKKNYKGEVSEIVNGEATVVFEDVPFGVYAVSSFHDENSNDKLDTGLFGIPKEPYASSKGAKNMFGPPRWKDAKFELNSDAQNEVIKF